jgi:YD repeat-containing protein
VSITRAVDGLGNITGQSDGDYNWVYSYDGIGRLTSITFPAGASASIGWSNTSRTLTRGLLNEVSTFDGFGRTVAFNKNSTVTTYRYDALGRKTFESFPGSSNGLTYYYDRLDRVTQIQSPVGSKIFDYSGGHVSVRNERNYTTTYDYARYGNPDAGFVTAITPPDASAKVTISRNELGIVSSVSQNGVTRTYGRDNRFFLTSLTQPEDGTTSLSPDNVGNTLTKTNNGHVVSYSYDGMNRPLTVSGNGISVTLTYNNRGKLHIINNSSAYRVYDYDANGNLSGDTLTIDGLTFAVGYGYDSIDGLSSITYPMSKGSVTYAPDANGRPQAASPYLTSVHFFPSGNLQSVTYGNNVGQSYGENNMQLPSSVTASAIQLAKTYGYDAASNVTSITDSYQSSESRTLNYDSMDRLNVANGPWGSGSIAYDPGGNITGQTYGSYSIAYTYSSNRIFSIAGSLSRHYSYDDPLGNVTGDGVNTYSFDDLSQLQCMACNTSSEVRFQYDGQGKRVSEDSGGNRTYFVQAPNSDLQFEYTPYGKRWVKHVYLEGKRVATEAGSDADLSTTSLSISPSAPRFGDALTLTASVSPSAASGSVEFIEGGTSLGVSVVGSGQGTLTIPGLSVGTHTITANYSGDGNYQPGSATTTFTVAKQDVVVTLSGATNTTLGQSLSLTAQINANQATGQVQFSDNGTPFATVQLSNGSASANTSALALGTHSFTAAYLGDGNYNTASSSPSVITVSRATPSVSLSAAPSTSQFGQVVIFNASVAGISGFVPTGTVTLAEGVNVLASGSLSNGTAALQVSSLAVGTHSITASYAGDGNYQPASSAAITQVVTEINVALATNGGFASASSQLSGDYPIGAINDGERAGVNWTHGGGWADGTVSQWPDWVQVDFLGSKTIDRVVLYTVQDNYQSPVEPTDTMTFSQLGITDFNVQGWDGAQWVTLASVAGTNLVKNTVSFSPFTTTKIRINVTGALYYVSRITEVEAWGLPAAVAPSNVALASAGAVASASSQLNASYPIAAINDGDSLGANWTNGGGWADGTTSQWPDWVELDLHGPKTLSRVVVYTVQDNYQSPVQPTDTTTFTQYGITDFDVEGWDGTQWVILATVSGNNLVKRTVTFDPFTTTKLRINVTNALYYVSRIVEVEAYGFSETNWALASNGAVASASSQLNNDFPISRINDGEPIGLNWTHGGGWADGTVSQWPDWVEIDLPTVRAIDTVVVYTVQDDYQNPVVPTDAMTFSQLGITDYEVQAWDGSQWVTVGAASGNNLVKRTFQFAPFTTAKVRVFVDNALYYVSRITEVEAYGH